MFQIVLIGTTEVRAHELKRVEKSSWVIVSKANLEIPLGNSNTPAQKGMEILDSMWKNIPLPNTIPPSFDVCNLTRRYELEISVGLVHGTVGNMKVYSLTVRFEVIC